MPGGRLISRRAASSGCERIAFLRALMPQLVNAVLQQSVTEQIVVGVRSFSKVFVGEIIEEGALAPTRCPDHAARRVQSQRGEAGPLQPDHLHEAYRVRRELMP